MRVAGNILVLILILSFQLSAQETNHKISLVDSIKQSINPLPEKLQFKNFFRTTLNKRMNQTDLISLRLYDEMNGSTLLLNDYLMSYDESINDSTEDFKKSFALLMEFAKHNQNKYDLGEFGRYLGISRDILAIILALISVAK